MRPTCSEGTGCDGFRGGPVRRLLNWPRYMKERRLADGCVGYYWVPHERDVVAGFTLPGEALGRSYADAIARAAELNAHLDPWRAGRGQPKDQDLSAKYGTVSWLFERYRRSAAYERVSEKTRPEYVRALNRIEDVPTKDGRNVGALSVQSITPRAADKIYAAVQQGPRGKRVRQANISHQRGAPGLGRGAPALSKDSAGGQSFPGCLERGRGPRRSRQPRVPRRMR